MKTNTELQRVISRIQQMEDYLDQVLKAKNASPNAVHEDASIRKMVGELTDYYESGQWLADYDMDANGDLPRGLKRGVLAQDTLYDLLAETGIDAEMS